MNLTRLERDIANCTGRHNYQQAWDYVRRMGYHTVINQVVTTHQVLAENQHSPEGPPPAAPSV